MTHIEDMLKPQPLDKKHVLGYVIASAVLLFGLMSSGIVYLQQKNPMTAVASLMPFLIISVVIFLFLGLTEKSRKKMGSEWEKQWIDYYTNPRIAMVKGN